MQTLLSLPQRLAKQFEELEKKLLPEWIPAFDPPGSALGSGGGTANLLAEAWNATGDGLSFEKWLTSSKKLIIHAGGQSRRLPAYAPTSKLGIPIPVLRWSRGQRIDQTLLDQQVPICKELLNRSTDDSVVMIASGDVLLRANLEKLPPLPKADVICIGLWSTAEQASNHGVIFSPRYNPSELSFFLQKPTPEEIRKSASDSFFMIDTGLWILSKKAVRVLMEKCGWDWNKESFENNISKRYELYDELGLGLGNSPSKKDSIVNELSSAVVPLPEGEFYHFGTNKDLIKSCARLQNIILDQREVGTASIKPHPEMFILNTPATYPPLKPENHTLWIENSFISKNWKINNSHIITGVPENNWSLNIPEGICLDLVPINDNDWCIRVYGIDDRFRGKLSENTTTLCNISATDWLKKHNLDPQNASLSLDVDIQELNLFPIVNSSQLTQEFVQWLLNVNGTSQEYSQLWLSSKRLSAQNIGNEINLTRLYNQRRKYLRATLQTLAENASKSIFYMLDLEHTAIEYSKTDLKLPESPKEHSHVDLMKHVHHEMFKASVLRLRGIENWQDHEKKAFSLLRDSIIDPAKSNTVRPISTALDDQIIWGRSPVRLDLAGGWTDTPPHCLIHGGRVVNLAVNLNGQPPIQAFVKKCDKFHILLRSIDLGVEEIIETYEQLEDFSNISGSFSIVKSALALVGFHPNFSKEKFKTLQNQLDDFGGGLEVSLLAAVPKGSGLGTSSILAGTLLGTLSDFCGLNWDSTELFRRVLMLEQMLTSGGGWQDQVGGLIRGLKLIETQPGISQIPVIRWIPDHLFTEIQTRDSMLLYYTGITRVAKNILQEIVRGMFLNSKKHEEVLQELSQHALSTYEVLIRGQWDGLCRSVNRSWQLNQQLDSGTNTPEIQSILNSISDWVAGAKLLGAGGGGYILIMAKDPIASAKIKEHLTNFPPNKKARFVDFKISQTGLEITRS